MGEISDMIVNGDLDYVTGEYLGPGYGVPRTLETSYNCRSSYNKYGYLKSVWNRKMSTESKEVIKSMYDNGFHDEESRNKIIHEFLRYELNFHKMPKNNKKYKVIYKYIDRFINFIKVKEND